MPYALRVRLYHAGELQADTDPDLPGGEPGAEVVATLDASQCALVELCRSAHGPDAQLLGFSDLALTAYRHMMRARAGIAAQFSYSQGYSVRQGHSTTLWLAQVDIAVAR